MNQSGASTQTICYHCGDICHAEKIVLSNKSFCCSGCKMVFEILNQNDLCDYYELNTSPGQTQRTRAFEGKFAFLQQTEMAAKLITFRDDSHTHVGFYLPQMHCSSCLWLLEQLSKFDHGIISSRVNFTKKECFVVFDHHQTSLTKVAELLAKIGYEPFINLADTKVVKRPHSDMTRVYKIGIAGFCFANIMMLSLPEYFSFGFEIEKNIGVALKYIMLGLSIPVVFYCAGEFFVSAWKGLRARFLNIDVPIALAIGITYIRSLVDILSGSGLGYLDSMSGIIFFMLVGRLLQDKTYKAISFDRDYSAFFPIAIDVKSDNKWTPRAVEQVKVDDQVLIHHHEIIPLDGLLTRGQALIDYSFVSGESRPVAVGMGQIIYAGGKQMGNNIELLVVKEMSQSYLTNLWNKENFKERDTPVSFIHQLSKHFTLVVFAIAAVTMSYWIIQGDLTRMWNAVTAIFIIACPCALLVAATFTNGNILRIFSKNKLYLRHPEVIEQMAGIDHIVFDKTGTITTPGKSKVSYHGRPLTETEENIIGSLMAHSTHPLSHSIRDHIQAEGELLVENFKNVPGMGIESWMADQHVRIGSAVFVGVQPTSAVEGSAVYIRFDQEIPGYFAVSNTYRKGFEALIQRLKAHFRISLLSGDNESEAPYLRQVFGEEHTLLFNQKPHEKLEYIKALQSDGQTKVMMIGDGLNDGAALRQANVGIAISETSNNFTPAADGILDAEKLVILDKFLGFSEQGKKIIAGSFVVSYIYNIIGLYFAVQGLLHPVIAAILMPASSLTILLITYGLSGYLGKMKKMNY